MTVCVGFIAQDGNVYLGADSRCSDGAGQTWTRKTPKAWVDGELAFAAAGNPTIAAELQRVPLPPIEPAEDLLNYLRLTLVDRLLAIAERLKLSPDDRYSIIVGGRGRIFLVDCWHDVLEPANGLLTTGSGGHFAMGALEAIAVIADNGFDVAPVVRVAMALQAACDHDQNCAPPFTVVLAPQTAAPTRQLTPSEAEDAALAEFFA